MVLGALSLRRAMTCRQYSATFVWVGEEVERSMGHGRRHELEVGKWVGTHECRSWLKSGSRF